jgi:hypothetical protein
MFIGHYGAALAAKRAAPRTSLGALFLGATLVDLVYSILLIAGIEKLRVVPGFTQAVPLDLYFMPYSHSLAGTVFWAALGALLYGLFAREVGDKKERVLAALVMGAVILSHFLLDFVTHVPDLPLGFEEGSPKVGLGLWNQLDVSMVLEVSVFVAGGAFYLLGTLPIRGRETPTIVVGVVLLALALASPFFPLPTGDVAIGSMELGTFLALSLLAEWMDRSREVVGRS